MKNKQTSRYIYNDLGKRISLPLKLEKEWDKVRMKLNPLARRQVK